MGLMLTRIVKVTCACIIFGTCMSSMPIQVKVSADEPASTVVASMDKGALKLVNDYIYFQLAVYCLPSFHADASPVLDALLEKRFSEFQRIEKFEDSLPGMVIAPRLEKEVKVKYAVPDPEFLRRFGRGLSDQQAQQLQDCQLAVILDFGMPAKQRWKGLRAACELVAELARKTDGLIWDEQTREVFAIDTWEDERLKSWKEAIPDVSDHTIIHAYNTGEHVRAISLGMSKFGLPDVVVDEFSWSLNNNMGILMNLLMQAMAEGAVVGADREFELNLRAIQNVALREPQIAALKPNATGVAKLLLKEGAWEEGDPDNRLIEIAFEHGDGPDTHAKQERLLGSFFGWEDSVSPAQHDDELMAASQRARDKLATLRSDFAKGLAPGEYILVKAPFDTPDGGQEWMWVEVLSWKQGSIRGLLKNEPYDIPDLHGGQEVDVAEDDVFDYIRQRPDGTQEGNETGEILTKQEESGG